MRSRECAQRVHSRDDFLSVFRLTPGVLDRLISSVRCLINRTTFLLFPLRSIVRSIEFSISFRLISANGMAASSYFPSSDHEPEHEAQANLLLACSSALQPLDCHEKQAWQVEELRVQKHPEYSIERGVAASHIRMQPRSAALS